jgi:hypothetical protein
VNEEIYPRLKASLRVLVRRDGTIYVGDARDGFILDLIPYRQILRLSTGVRTHVEIARQIDLSASALLQLLHQLTSCGVIEILSAPSHTGAQHHLNASERVESERSLITHRSIDGGQEELHARAAFRIEIRGDTRIARNLLALLVGSGFISTTLQLSPNDQPLLHARDLNALSVTSEHLGMSKALHHRDILRQNQLVIHNLARTDLRVVSTHGKNNLIVATAGVDAQEIQQWQSEGVRHLAISEVIAQTLEISPIIEPGIGPCLRCLSLHRRDALPEDLSLLAQSEPAGELPVASAALVAALLAAKIANFAYAVDCAVDYATGIQGMGHAEELEIYRRRSQVINLLDPSLPMEDRRWNFHPECGCVDVRRRALPR